MATSLAARVLLFAPWQKRTKEAWGIDSPSLLCLESKANKQQGWEKISTVVVRKLFWASKLTDEERKSKGLLKKATQAVKMPKTLDLHFKSNH